MRSQPIFQLLALTMVSNSATSARFRNVGELLNVACLPMLTASGAPLQWMILFSSELGFPQTMLAALKDMECDYEVRTIESFSSWKAPDQAAYMDYKVIGIGITMGALRDALYAYVSSQLRTSRCDLVTFC